MTVLSVPEPKQPHLTASPLPTSSSPARPKSHLSGHSKRCFSSTISSNPAALDLTLHHSASTAASTTGPTYLPRTLLLRLLLLSSPLLPPPSSPPLSLATSRYKIVSDPPSAAPKPRNSLPLVLSTSRSPLSPVVSAVRRPLRHKLTGQDRRETVRVPRPHQGRYFSRPRLRPEPTNTELLLQPRLPYYHSVPLPIHRPHPTDLTSLTSFTLPSLSVPEYFLHQRSTTTYDYLPPHQPTTQTLHQHQLPPTLDSSQRSPLPSAVTRSAIKQCILLHPRPPA